MYTKMRAILTLCDITLPAWATIQASRARIRKLLDDQILYSTSPFGTPIFALNPEKLIARARKEGRNALAFFHCWQSWLGWPHLS
jgi:hypothetical protein